MASEKLPIKDILAAIDMGAKNVWDELSDDERKQISFWLLNRWVSSIRGSREDVELAIFKTNEYYNKNWTSLSTKHPKLQWQLLCIAGGTGDIKDHQWIGFKQKSKANGSVIKVLEQIYPEMKQDEVELLARISTTKEIKKLAEEYNIDVKL